MLTKTNVFIDSYSCGYNEALEYLETTSVMSLMDWMRVCFINLVSCPVGYSHGYYEAIRREIERKHLVIVSDNGKYFTREELLGDQVS